MTVVTDRPTAGPSTSGAAASSPKRRTVSAWLTGGHSRWERPILAGILTFAAVCYLWALDSLGWANDYYAAAVQAGTQSWKALLFGSLDAGNAITVDKPPVSLWAMSLSGRIFGFNSWSMLAPQALMGVAIIALLYATVRRTSGVGAGLIAAAALALTPVAALMFRYNNPDAMLVLLLVAAAYFIVRALADHPLRWTALAGTAVGFAFLTKLMQALLVVPAIGFVLLVALPGSFWHRLRVGLVGLAAMVVSGGWFVALVSLWPAGSRPYIGGSTTNSLLELTLGYNGLGRVFGGDGNPTAGAGGPGGPGGPGGMPGPGGGGGFRHGFGGAPGWTRMFGDSMGTEISWLLPAALIALVVGLWLTRKAVRTDLMRAALLLWGGWLLVTAAVFSTMKGIMHPYYTVALAPEIAALVGIGAALLWDRRDRAGARIALAVMVAVTGVWNFVLLDRTPEWLPWLRWVLLAGAGLAAVALIVGARRERWAAAVAAFALVVGLGGTGAYMLETVAHQQHGGPMLSSGPAQAGDHRGPGNQGPGGRRDGRGPGRTTEVSEQLRDMLSSTESRWAAATIGSHSSGSLQLSSRRPIMAIGGFNGGDAAPTLEQFQRYVRDGQIAYFIVDDRGPGGRGGPGSGPGARQDGRGGPGGPGGRSGTATEITEWVKANFTAQNIDGTTVYDLRH